MQFQISIYTYTYVYIIIHKTYLLFSNFNCKIYGFDSLIVQLYINSHISLIQSNCYI